MLTHRVWSVDAAGTRGHTGGLLEVVDGVLPRATDAVLRGLRNLADDLDGGLARFRRGARDRDLHAVPVDARVKAEASPPDGVANGRTERCIERCDEQEGRRLGRDLR